MGCAVGTWLVPFLAGLAVLVGAVPSHAFWQVLRTPRVYVYFPAGYEAAALRAAEVADQALQELEPKLEHTLEGPLHLVLSDRTDLANGFTDVSYYNRVVIFPVFPVGLGYTTGLSPRMEDWLRLVITHELVHAVHLDMNEGPARGLRSLFGHVPGFSTPNIIQPRSWLEGIATWLETRQVSGGRGEDPLFDMFLRTDVLAGRLPELDQTLGLYDLERFQPTGTVYLYGYVWFDYLARRYGEQAILRMQRGFASVRYALPGEAVRDVLRQPIGAVWQEMRRELESQFRRQIQAIEARGVSRPQALPSSGWVVVTPRFSPDGRRVAYAAQSALAEDLRLLDVAGGGDRQLVLARTTAPGGLDWTPDGRQIVYSAVERRNATEYSDLFAYDLEQGAVRRLTRNLRAYAPAVSPDGRQVVFAARQGLSTRLMVLELGQAASQPRVVWQPPEGWQILSVAWRPGPWVAVSVWRPGGFADILLLKPAASTPQGLWTVWRWVTWDRAVDDRPAWSPDGRYLLFHSDRDGIYNLYAAEPESGRVFRLTNVLTGAFDPTVSPDGSAVVFSWYQPDGYRLALLPWNQLRWEPVAIPAPPPDGEGAAQAAGGQARSGLPSGWRVEPYRPWSTLAPQFWLPISSEDWAGPQVGLTTAGQDVLGEHQYVVEAATGLVSGEPRLYAGYLYSARQGAGPFVLVEGESRPVPAESGWERVSQGRLALAVVDSRDFRAAGLQVGLFTGEQRRLVDNSGHPVSGASRSFQAGDVSLQLAGMTADHRRAYVAGAALTLGSVFRRDGQALAPLPWGWGVARLTLRQLRPGQPGWRAELGAGVLGPSLGQEGLPGWETSIDPGRPGPFQVRAFAPGELEPAHAAAAARWEWARRWRTIQRGLGDAPVFARSLDWALFAEAVSGWRWDGSDRLQPAGWGLAAAAGAELRLNLSLSYGTAPLSLRLGVARGLAPYPVTRIYFTLSSS